MSENSLEPRARPPLTPRQRELLDYIEGYIAQYQYPPTLREMGDALGIGSTNGITCKLQRLEALGYLEVSGFRQARSLRVLDGVDARRPKRIACAVPSNAVACVGAGL